ncbi:UV radiation resistance-associatedprotein isoform X1 [Tripterygium wilfordii]|uniref:UV radiation resistance-associatedprotein isoform X1 n=1 Tax=Tripterygium wilfordii TaxID=458696 RepID=A0A7J7E1P8_TRIWF|nr:UV radiation resistance-associated gene protein [Tripterygium wilfordii]KAF5752528.1 UV radiation resistance-associatedprotein isoform X1 [Tripterygium wilfordii]
MDRDRTLSAELKKRDSENVKVIEWEDYEQEVARLWSLSSAVREAKEKKRCLEEKVETLIQAKAESLSRINTIDEMNERVDTKKSVVKKMLMHTKIAADDAKSSEERLSMEVRSLLVAGTALSAANKCLQESRRSIDGERGYSHLVNLQTMLRVRQQYMISQVSLLYPVKNFVGPAQEQELESFPSTSRTGNSIVSKPVNQGSLTILGLRLTMVPFTKMTFFTDKKEVRMSATALGYVAHAVSLIASYLGVPLRYPVRFGGSHSYINVNAPSIEATSCDLPPDTDVSADAKAVEFPLFLEGQDTTRAAYAVFLLNKDLEQLLNFIGEESLGPSNVLGNLKELMLKIQSAEYIDI